MSAAWVAGTVRSKALARRRVGAAGARAIAASPDLAGAVAALSATPYGHDVHPSDSLADAQHGVGATLLWHARVLAGWLPGEGARAVRVLAAGFEIANLDEHLATLGLQDTGGSVGSASAYHLGALETVWGRARGTGTIGELRTALGSSPWGDPGESTGWSMHVGLRLAWADRVVSAVPEAAVWARAATALLIARDSLLGGNRLSGPLRRRAVALLGSGFVDSASAAAVALPDLAAALPARERWVLDGVRDPEALWRAEAGWWHRVELDGFGLLRDPGFGRPAAVGALAVLAADAWRVRAGLEVAARAPASPAPSGSVTPLEAFDGVA